MSVTACLGTTARRLRYLRRHPNTEYWVKDDAIGEAFNKGMSSAYEYALRVILDEFGITEDEWFAHMYGPQIAKFHTTQATPK